MATFRLLTLFLSLAWLTCLSTPSPAQDDWVSRASELIKQARYGEAEQFLKGIMRDVEAEGEPVLTTSALTLLAEVYNQTGNYEEGEKVAQRGIDLAKRNRNDHALIAPLQIMGVLHRMQRKLPESEAESRQALVLIERQYGTETAVYAEGLENLAATLDQLGRFQDAEPLLQRALAIRIRILGPHDYHVAQTYFNLGFLYYQHDRLDDAYAYERHALKLWEETSGRDSRMLCHPLWKLVQVCTKSKRWEEAKAYHERLMQISALVFGADSEGTMSSDALLGDLYVAQKKYAEAEPVYRRYLDYLTQKGPLTDTTAGLQISLAEVCLGLGRHQEAEELCNQALVSLEKMDYITDLRCRAHFVRGRVRHEKKRLVQAIADLRESVRLAEDIRSRLSGSDQERAGSFSSSLRDKYLALFRVLLESGDLPAAMAIAEQGRARSLFDQMQTARADLLAGLPGEQAQALRQALHRAEAQVAQLERQLKALGDEAGITPEVRRTRQRELIQKQLAAREELVDAHTAIRNASPLYRKTLAKDFVPVSLKDFDAWLADRKSCLLYYLVDNERAIVVSRGKQPEHQVVRTLEITVEQAQVLGVPAGPLNSESLEKILQSKDGVLPHLSRPNTAKQAEPRLAVLWEVLVPPAIRTALQNDEYEGVVVVPDGALGVLPFETLIVEAGDEPQYLLDVCPPIVYAPSLTLLHTLAGRAERVADSSAKLEPVLTLGDPVYSGTPIDPTPMRSAGLRTRYGALGGKLARLPFTASESHWVKQALQPAGWSSVQLLEGQATEAAVRSKIAGRTIVHLACHGLADQQYGNFFGALALTPGPAGSPAANDGFLTLPEVCELNLSGNELTMLSACQTNYGPQQQGEGVWALTRGFLIAGSRRVMASNWVVDDKAAATLVYYFALNIADEKNDKLDYALALHKAKRSLRKQSQWQSPFYWGSLVMIGPK